MNVAHRMYRAYSGAKILAMILTNYIINWNDFTPGSDGSILPKILIDADGNDGSPLPAGWTKDGNEYPGWVGTPGEFLPTAFQGPSPAKTIVKSDGLIYVGVEPDTAAREGKRSGVITLFDFSSKGPQLTNERDISPPYNYDGIQVRVKHSKYDVGFSWMNTIKLLLHGFNGYSFDPSNSDRRFDFVSSIMCTIPPAIFDRTENLDNRLIMSFELQTN